MKRPTKAKADSKNREKKLKPKRARRNRPTSRKETKRGKRARGTKAEEEVPQPWLIIKVDGVEGSGGSKMSFTVSVMDQSVSVGTQVGQERDRIIYDGPYTEGPYWITVEAEELGESDDEFTSEPGKLVLDMTTLQGSVGVVVTQKPGDKDDKDVGDDPNDPEDPDEQASYTVTVVAELIPIAQLTQTNYPDTGNQDIQKDSVAYITADPFMPKLVAKVKPPVKANVNWKFDLTYPRRRGRGDTPGEDDRHYAKSLPGDQEWTISDEFGNQFFGGNARLSYTIGDLDEEHLIFFIKGKNPDDGVAKSYIQSRQGIHFYAWAIAQEESRQGEEIYNQFNTSGSRAEEPNFGAPDGWGIFQRDPSEGGMETTTDQLWNWKVNVDAGIAELNVKRNQAQAFFSVLRSIYQPQGTWEEPPSSFVAPGTATALSALDAATITLYNGGAPRAKIWVVNGNIVGRGAHRPPNVHNPEVYNSCWIFQPEKPVGQRWEFVPNTQNYLYKVIHEEYEGHP